MGDLYRTLGQGDQGAGRLPQVPPDQRASGPGRTRPRRLPARPLRLLRADGRPLPRPGPGRTSAGGLPQVPQIRESLAQAEPDRADYQRDLSVSYDKMGDLYRTLGQGEQAPRPTSRPSPSPSVWPRPNPTAPITSVPRRLLRADGRPLSRARAGHKARRPTQGPRHRRALARPNPNAPTTSATSPSLTSGWATSIAPSGRATPRGRPTSSPTRS